MAFVSIEDDVLWKEDRQDGQWVVDSNGNPAWQEGLSEFVEFEGEWEPYTKGITTEVLPEGVTSGDVIMIYTSEYLHTPNDLSNNEAVADTIYIDDPTVENSTAMPYVIWNAAPYKANKGFKLLPTFVEYIAIRKEKVN